MNFTRFVPASFLPFLPLPARFMLGITESVSLQFASPPPPLPAGPPTQSPLAVGGRCRRGFVREPPGERRAALRLLRAHHDRGGVRGRACRAVVSGGEVMTAARCGFALTVPSRQPLYFFLTLHLPSLPLFPSHLPPIPPLSGTPSSARRSTAAC